MKSDRFRNIYKKKSVSRHIDPDPKFCPDARSRKSGDPTGTNFGVIKKQNRRKIAFKLSVCKTQITDEKNTKIEKFADIR